MPVTVASPLSGGQSWNHPWRCLFSLYLLSDEEGRYTEPPLVASFMRHTALHR